MVSQHLAGERFDRALRWAPLVLALVGGGLLSTAPLAGLILIVLGGGLALTLMLFPGRTFLSTIGLSVLFGELLLLASVLLRHALDYRVGTIPTLLLLALMLAAWALLASRNNPPRIQWFGREDVVTLILGAAIFAFGFVVFSANGYRSARDGGEEYVARGYVNGDTMTLFALTQRAQDAGRWELRNPFAGNGALEYPTLLHTALGDILRVANSNITHAAWALLVFPLFGTVAALGALFARLAPEGTHPLWGAGAGLWALAYSWDGFVYPQSHTFLLGLFLLFVLLLVASEHDTEGARRSLPLVAAWVIALVLLFSNAVLGTAAVAIVVGVSLVDAVHTRTRVASTLALLGSAVLVVLFMLFPPGEGGLGALNVPYTVFPVVGVLALPAGLIVLALTSRPLLYHRTLSVLTGVLPALTIVALFFSRRDIVADNASRFLFLLLVTAWPVAILTLTEGVARWRALWRASGDFAPRVLLVSGGLLVALVLLLPPLGIVLQTTDALVRSEPRRVSPAELAAYAWIRAHTPADTVFARAPESLFEDQSVSPLSLPGFTGLAQLRSDFWLSPDDSVTDTQRALFRGERTNLPDTDYIFCGPERSFCPEVGAVAYAVDDVVIRQWR